MILHFLISSILLANASGSSCTDSVDIEACLEERANNALANQQNHFENQLNQIVTDQRLNGFNIHDIQSLVSAFRIEVPSSRDNLSVEARPCFDWSDSTFNRIRGYSRERILGLVTDQMNEVAVFLRNYHVFSLGKESSYLYQIRRVEICQGEQSINFEKNVLKIFLSLDYLGSPYTGREIFDLWNDGTIVFGRPLNIFTKIKASLMKDTKSLLNDRMRDAWLVLNPIGDIRQRLRLAITQGVLSEIKRIIDSIASPNTLAVQVLSEHGLSDTRQDYSEVMRKWLANLQDNNLINQITEQALFARNVGSMRLQNNDQRKQIALFALKNNKQINVDLSGLFSTLYTSEDLLGDDVAVSEVSLNSNSWQVAGIAIDLVDQVNVSVRVPNNLVETIKKLSIKKALE